MTDVYEAVDAAIVGDADGTREVERNLYTLCDEIGARFAGTAGYRRAADYMRDRLEAYGLAGAHLERFALTTFERGAAELTMVEPFAEAVACYELVYSAATGPAGIEVELIDLGDGLPERFAAKRDEVKGRLVLIPGGRRHRMEIYETCVEFGAAGMIYSSHMPGMVLCSGAVGNGKPGAIPAVSVGREAALKLQRLCGKGTVKLRLMTDSRCEGGETWNVVGEIAGREKPAEMVIVGGHLDSHEIGPGAYDNGAGAVMVMEMARLLASQREHVKRTVRFIGFAAEEVGLLGSEYHAAANRDALAGARLMFNCDMPAISEPWIVAAHRFSAFEDYVVGLSERMGVELTYRLATHCHSDHYPFTRLGIPGLALAGSRTGLKVGGAGHTAADTPEKIPTDQLAAAAGLAARIVLRAANEEDWPAGDGV